MARIAGIMAAKRTSELIPMCHPLPLSLVDVEVRVCENGVAITSKVGTSAETGVEMEALVAVSVSALTFYDMLKAADKRNRDSRHRARTQERRQERGVPEAEQISDPMADNVKLLLVDDNPMVLGMLHQALVVVSQHNDRDRCR